MYVLGFMVGEVFEVCEIWFDGDECGNMYGEELCGGLGVFFILGDGCVVCVFFSFWGG